MDATFHELGIKLKLVFNPRERNSIALRETAVEAEELAGARPEILGRSVGRLINSVQNIELPSRQTGCCGSVQSSREAEIQTL